MLKIDIVTISFNSEKTIERTLSSVQEQREFINNYIVIDGNSTDKTREIISKYSDIITFAKSENDRGISDAFNKGIEKCTGDFILLLNSDDWLVPGSLKKILPKLSVSDELVCTNMISVDANGNLAKCRSLPARLKLYNSVLHPGLIVSRTVYDSIGLYDTSIKYAMDYDFLLRCKIAKKKFTIIDEDFVFFQEGGNSANPMRIFQDSYMIRRNHLFLAIPIYEIIQISARLIGNRFNSGLLYDLKLKLKKRILN